MAESHGALAVREQQATGAEISGSTLTGAQLKFIANTEFVPRSFRGNLPAIMACVATGRALGIADMAALRSINIIDGKAAFSAELMVQLVRQAGHSITFKATGDSCTVYGKRSDNGDDGEFTWTLDMAKRAGLLDKKGETWKRYPEAMLWARAVSQLCRMLFADCFAGATYTPEELGYGDVTADELMDEPAGGEAAHTPGPEESAATDDPALPAEIIDEQDEPAAPPAEQTGEQKDKLLELFSALADARPDVEWGPTLTRRIKQEYGAEKYNDLTGAQMTELLEWLEGELPKRRGRAA